MSLIPAGPLKSLLIVEDDTGFTAFLRPHLPAEEFKVDTARDLQEAISAIRSASTSYDYALIDLWLPMQGSDPDGAQLLTGLQLAQHIHGASPSTFLIGMSQFATERMARLAARSLGAFVSKANLLDDPTGVLLPILASCHVRTPPRRRSARKASAPLMHDVFLSYSRNDQNRAATLVRLMEDHGLSVWWDRTLQPGADWGETLQEAAESAKCVVVLWSKASVASKWVRNEASVGDERKVLVPILIQDSKIPLGFRHLQTANLIDRKCSASDPEVIKVFDSISRLTGGYTE